MQTSKALFRIVTLTLAATLITACSKEAKKTRFLAEADNYFKAGDYDKAKVSYLNVLRLDPQNALAFERIGAMWLEGGSPLRAAAFLARASELAPKNDQNRIRLARCYVAVGQFADANKEALKVLEQTSDNGDAIVVLTEAVRSKEDIRTAEEQLGRNTPKRTTFLSTLLRRICFLTVATWLRQKTPSGGRLPSIPILLSRTWRWDICTCSRKIRNKPAKNLRKRPSLRLFVLWSA